MSFADLLGGLVDDLIRGRSNSMGRRIQSYMATTAREGVTKGVKAVQDHRAEAAKAAAEAEAKEAARVPENEAWVLLLAMISAAASDGEIDPIERNAIMDKATKAELSEADSRKLEQALEKPLSATEVAAMVTTEEQKEQVYVMTLAAITVDTDAERAHLETLKKALALPAELVEQLERDLMS